MNQYVIWSIEHTQWWKPGKRGYTTRLVEAGRYSERDALQIVEQANVVRVNECLIPVAMIDADASYDARIGALLPPGKVRFT